MCQENKHKEINMPTDELDYSIEADEEEVIELQFKAWEYPSLEDAVLEYTMEHEAYCNIFSYVSRCAGIDNQVMPKTLLVCSGYDYVCVYSPYSDLIGKRLKQEDLGKYVNLNTGKEVTFKFIPYKSTKSTSSITNDVCEGKPVPSNHTPEECYPDLISYEGLTHSENT
jgi:hypothetical protein